MFCTLLKRIKYLRALLLALHTLPHSLSILLYTFSREKKMYKYCVIVFVRGVIKK